MARSSFLTATVALGAALVLAGALAACGSASPGGASGSPPPSPGGDASSGSASPVPPSAGQSPPVTSAPPMIMLVRLGTAFSPAEIQLGVGQHFQLAVGKNVLVHGLGVDAGCPQGTTGQALNGFLSVRCTGNNGYLYTALRTGSEVLAVTVQPRCEAGTMCPAWVARATLKITVT